MRGNSSFKGMTLLGAGFAFVILAGAYILQYFFKLEPCSLCILQRWMLWGIFILFVIAALHNPARVGRWIYLLAVMVLSVLGGMLAGRQIYLQQLPPESVPECTAGLDRLVDVLPFFEAIKTVLTTAGECAKVEYTILGISLSEWSLFTFFIVFVYCIKIMTKKLT